MFIAHDLNDLMFLVVVVVVLQFGLANTLHSSTGLFFATTPIVRIIVLPPSYIMGILAYIVATADYTIQL
jgi:hypothetical protein